VRLEPRHVLARYELDALLARGATGAVYRALDTATGQTVAVKVMDSGPAAGPCSGERVARLGRYVDAMRTLEHAAIVAVHDAGCDGPHDWIVMELAPGCDLAGLMAVPRPLSIVSVLRIAAQVARALAHAHARGIVHGDVKPANVLYYETGSTVVKVTDFALQGVLPGAGAGVAGTPLYMAPERLCGGRAWPAADQFSLAVMLYRLVSGRLPYGGATRPEIVWNMVHGAPRLLDESGPAPAALAVLLARGLQKAPERRYADMTQMAGAIESVLAALRPTASTV
jgi:eukaryotic-like serine/threonine-protein kinase